MNDPNIRNLDIRTALTFITLLVVISGAVAGLSRLVWLADIGAAVGDHTIERGQWRQQVDSRFSRLEEQCIGHKEWRDDADQQLKDLYRWRANCSEKQAELKSRLDQHDRSDDAVINQLNRRQDWIEQQLRARP